ncbi:MAG: hypothetical protein IKF17_05560 [Clostridia bacterium]|nr:hypothetical protein [Clostridia bacterium]
MNTTSLYNILEKEKINYSNHQLLNSGGMIAHYKDITAIIVDEQKADTTVSRNTVLIQELGHYFSGSYYKTDSDYEIIAKAEFKADKRAWKDFFPYERIKLLMKKGYTTATQLAEQFDVEATYMARCLNYYYDNSHGFTDEKVSI